MNDERDSSGRRVWLVRFLGGSLVASMGVFFYPIARFLRPRAVTKSGALEIVAPLRVHELKPDVNGEWPPPFDFGGKPCLVIRTTQGEVKALNAICTHTDCTVKYRVDKGDIFCSCHGGVYDLNGRNVSGPPPRPLETYKVILRGKPGQEEIVVTHS